MNPRFVSDLVETLIPETGAYRALLRQQTQLISSSLANHVYGNTTELLANAGTKCMGYPAVWFSATAVGGTVDTCRTLWPQYSGSVLISLSTSLIDDVLDEGSNLATSRAVAAYRLIFAALSCPNNREIVGILESHTEAAIPSFVSRAVSEQTLYGGLNRIGGFFAAIGHQIARSYERDRNVTLAVSEACGQFGRWLCLLDDVIDARRDADLSLPYSCINSGA